MKRTTFWCSAALGAALIAQAGLADDRPRVVALTSIMADVTRSVGGEHIEVIDLMGVAANPHTFDPKPSDLVHVASARLIVASGKGLEDSFMEKIRDNLAADTIVVELGRKVPSCMVDSKSELFVCCPTHALGGLDPHWWHSVKGMKRAVQQLGASLAKIDPAHADAYKSNARAYSDQLKELDDWARSRIAAIPKSRRYLTTAHAAWGYFCRDYGFRSIPVQGLTGEPDPSPVYLAETIRALKKHRIRAVFPESQANPKVLQSMVRESGARIGGRLLADSLTEDAPTYLDMVRHNVNTIVEALR